MIMSRELPNFKPYYHHQWMAFPPTFDELITQDHPVRTIDQVINSINIDGILDKYYKIGAGSYYPLMLLKVLIYGYVSNIYPSNRTHITTRNHSVRFNRIVVDKVLELLRS